ncbi:MAG: hypothetical protein WC343_13125, partial [Bacilli bacterium]
MSPEPMTWYQGHMIPRAEYERIMAGETDATTNHNGSPADGAPETEDALAAGAAEGKAEGPAECLDAAPVEADAAKSDIASSGLSPIPEQLRGCRFILVKA